jgi:hypothetical protein
LRFFFKVRVLIHNSVPACHYFKNLGTFTIKKPKFNPVLAIMDHLSSARIASAPRKRTLKGYLTLFLIGYKLKP